MKKLIFAFFALLTVCPGWAQAQVRGIEIVAYGIYTAEVQSSKRDIRGIKQTTSTNFRRAVATTAIPAQLGLRFGMQYKVIGAPAGKTISLKSVVVYPPAGLRSPAVAQPILRNETTSTAKIGETTYEGYRFDDPWELVPGPWTIQLWYGDRKLAEQTFTVTAP
ncbi:MAG: DUF3859 domain-containing protein [Pseudolabrys sp.]